MRAHIGNIWKAVSKDEVRPVLCHVAFDAEKGTLTASDSYILAQVPCEVEPGDDSGLIPADAIREAEGRSLRVAGGKATLSLPDGERSWNLLTDGVFPDAEMLLSKAPSVPVRFGINAGLLARLSEALGAFPAAHEPVVLHPRHPLKPMRVETREAVGVVMPVRMSGVDVVEPPDFSDDELVVAAAQAAVKQLKRRRGKARAAQAFREALQRSCAPS